MKRQILITGASSGIGAALAEQFARQLGPDVVLGLVARRSERLTALAERLERHGSRVLNYVADVRERERMAEVGRAFIADAGGITLAIANAGVSHGDGLRDGDAGPAVETMLVNVAGVMHTLQPLIPTMIAQGHGQLVAVGSIAGFRGMPGRGAYCASKAAVKTLMDAWRGNLRKYGVRVTTLCPGWVVSELTENNPYRMPFTLETDVAARKMMRAIERGATTYVLPWQMRMILPLLKAWPERLLPRYGTRS